MSRIKKALGIVLTLLLLAACATAMGETDIQAFIDANTIGSIQQIHPICAQTVTIYEPDDGAISQRYTFYSEVDPDKGTTYSIVDQDGNIMIYGRGEGYRYVYDDNQFTVYGFLGSTYEELMSSLYAQNAGEFFDGTKIVAEEMLEDGDMVITTEGVLPADYELTGGAYAGQTLVVYYIVNPETLIIESSDIYVRGEDGAELVIADALMEFDETVDLPFDLEALRNPEKTRELHVILDPGTDNEFDHVFTAPLNAGMSFYMPQGYEMYTDKDCTVLMTDAEPDENGNYPDNLVFYCAPVK